MLVADSQKRLFIGARLANVYRGPRRTRHASAGTSGSTMTAITSSGSINTKGDYAQLTASAAFDADGFILTLDPGETSNRDFLVDIGTGASLSETVILSNVLASYRGNGLFEAFEAYVPLPIRAGTRVAARCQSSAASAVMSVGIELVAGPHYRAMRMERANTYGADTSDSGGTVIDPGGSAGTEGAWTELSAALSNRVEYVIVCVGNRLNSARTTGTMAIDLGVGASLSEVEILPQMYARMENSRDGTAPQVRARWLHLEEGQRLVGRAVSSVTDATDRLVDLVVIGFSR